MTVNEKLLKLIAEHPDYPVVPLVDYEVVADDSCGYWYGSFKNCEVKELCYVKDRWGDDRIVYKEDSDDWDEIERLFPESDDEAYTEEKLTEMFLALPFVKAIVLWIDLPDENAYERPKEVAE